MTIEAPTNAPDDDCPICGLPMNGVPALSRFNNTTYVCSACGQAEAVGFMFSTLSDVDSIAELPVWLELGYDDCEGDHIPGWLRHCLVVAMIRGSSLGRIEKVNAATRKIKPPEYYTNLNELAENLEDEKPRFDEGDV